MELDTHSRRHRQSRNKISEMSTYCTCTERQHKIHTHTRWVLFLAVWRDARSRSAVLHSALHIFIFYTHQDYCYCYITTHKLHTSFLCNYHRRESAAHFQHVVRKKPVYLNLSGESAEFCNCLKKNYEYKKNSKMNRVLHFL